MDETLLQLVCHRPIGSHPSQLEGFCPSAILPTVFGNQLNLASASVKGRRTHNSGWQTRSQCDKALVSDLGLGMEEGMGIRNPTTKGLANFQVGTRMMAHVSQLLVAPFTFLQTAAESNGNCNKPDPLPSQQETRPEGSLLGHLIYLCVPGLGQTSDRHGLSSCLFKLGLAISSN